MVCPCVVPFHSEYGLALCCQQNIVEVIPYEFLSP